MESNKSLRGKGSSSLSTGKYLGLKRRQGVMISMNSKLERLLLQDCLHAASTMRHSDLARVRIACRLFASQ